MMRRRRRDVQDTRAKVVMEIVDQKVRHAHNLKVHIFDITIQLDSSWAKAHKYAIGRRYTSPRRGWPKVGHGARKLTSRRQDDGGSLLGDGRRSVRDVVHGRNHRNVDEENVEQIGHAERGRHLDSWIGAWNWIALACLGVPNWKNDQTLPRGKQGANLLRYISTRTTSGKSAIGRIRKTAPIQEAKEAKKIYPSQRRLPPFTANACRCQRLIAKRKEQQNPTYRSREATR